MSSTKTYVSAQFQIGVFIIANLILIAVLYKPMQRLTCHDQKPHFIAGAPAHSSPSVVRAGLLINSFSKFDIHSNDFIFEGKVWFEFDPVLVTVKELETFDINHGEILERSKPIISVHGNETVAVFFIRAHFKTNLDYKAFPLDSHTIYIAITNRYLDAHKIIFEPVIARSMSQKDLLTRACSYDDMITESGYVLSEMPLKNETVKNSYPQFIYGIKCRYIGLRCFINIFLPLLLIFFFSLFAFSLDFKEHGQMVPTIASAGIPALLAYRFVIEALSPRTAYNMLSDYLFFLFLFLMFAIFIIIAASVHTSERTKQITIISLYACMLIGCTILFNWIL